MTLLSFINDFVVYRVTNRLFKSENIALAASILFASSYTSWVYCTRTFSNSIETILFGLLLDLVTRDDEAEGENRNTNASTNAGKENAFGTQKCAFCISAVLVSGFFIRTSFLCFAFVPILYWVCKGAIKESVAYIFSVIFIRSLSLLPGIYYTALAFLVADYAYYRQDELAKLPVLLYEADVSALAAWVHNIPLTPLNAMAYNWNVSNLEMHGLHPWFLHVTVNMPLMFTPVVYVLVNALCKTDKYLYGCSNLRGNHDLFLLLFSSVLFSLSILSTFQHQEPRFVLPLIIPVTILLSRCLYPFSCNKFLITIWIVFNFSFFAFFGIFHQGGVVPSMDYVGSLARVHNENHLQTTRFRHVIFYKTYMPPIHLAAISNKNSPHRKFLITDLAGSPHKKLEETLQTSLVKPNSEVYLALPTSLPCSQWQKLRQNYILKEQFGAYPHLSLETPPWSRNVCGSKNDAINTFFVVLDQMALSIYLVKPLHANVDPEMLEKTKYAIYSPPKLQTSTL